MDKDEKPENGPTPKVDDSTSPALTCALCGCSTPAVRCDRCSSQIFCLSCDDMYHRHPKRRLHLRKAVDSIWNSSRSPKLRRKTDLPGDPSKIPIPPPRTKKRERHMIGGRMFLKSSHELGSFGYSKVFDSRHLTPPLKESFAGQKSPSSLEGNYENDSGLQAVIKPDDIYENDNIMTGPNQGTPDNVDRSPWNTSTRPNISSPIQVSIPSNSDDMAMNGQSFNYPHRHQSRSAADLAPPISAHHYPFPPHYPYMPHQPLHSSFTHPNCAQCISSSWSNLMSPHPSPFFHPVPWGPIGATHNGHGRHSHGDLAMGPDPNLHAPFHPGAFYMNGNPMDPRNGPQPSAHSSKSKKSESPKHRPVDTASNAGSDTGASQSTEAAEPSPVPPSNKAKLEEPDPPAPIKPTAPWSCLHCTFINPAGIYICQVCCKTSYGSGSAEERDSQGEARARNFRDSESPMELVNMDADANSSYLRNAEMQKVN